MKTKWPGVIDLLGGSSINGGNPVLKSSMSMDINRGRYQLIILITLEIPDQKVRGMSGCAENDGIGESALLCHCAVTRQLRICWVRMFPLHTRPSREYLRQ